MSSKATNKLEDGIRGMPDAPGVYIMKDARGRIIYVGKAKRLKDRVRSYFHSGDALDAKTRSLVKGAASIDYIATGSEVEALVLECNMIKEYRPKYNIKLKDDKRYPYLKITLKEEFPRLLLVRRIESDGSEYFGPFTEVKALRRTIAMIQAIFKLRTCSAPDFPGRKERECLNFQIGRCPAPCTGRVTREEYAETVGQVRLFLKGHTATLRGLMEKRMKELSIRLRYEEASVVRDQIATLERITENRHAVEPGGEDEDIVSIASEGSRACGIVMKVREGKMLGSETFMLPATLDLPARDLFSKFLELYYHSAYDIPQRILVQHEPPDPRVIEEWLSGKSGRRVSVSVPSRGTGKRLLDLAEKNASMKLFEYKGRRSADVSLLVEVKKTLGLSSTPLLIEAFDISNIQGSEAVGSMVTFDNGKPLKSGYRHFRIREAEGIDDFAMMREVIRRRCESLRTGKSRHPDLIMVDGGIGQVNAALKGLELSGASGIPVIGLAKKNEEIHQAGKRDVIRLPRSSSVLKLFQRMRDEAHRFAVEYHRKLRSRKIIGSKLDAIPGIGAKRKISLLVELGSVEAVSSASVEELAAVKGIGRNVAEKIHEFFHHGR